MLHHLTIELFILRNYFALLKKDFSKYFKVASMCYLYGSLRLSKPAKPAYFLCRYIDDVADGDKKLPSSYKSYEQFFDRLKTVATSPQLPLTPIEKLLNTTIKSYKYLVDNDMVVRNQLERFICSMAKERARRIANKYLNAREILSAYDESFGSVLQLTLIGLKIEIPHANVQQLGRLQGRLYAIDDLEEDLKSGIINIPNEIINKEGFAFDTNNMVLKQWIDDEYRTCSAYVNDLMALELSGRQKKLVMLLVKPLAKSIESHFKVKAVKVALP